MKTNMSLKLPNNLGDCIEWGPLSGCAQGLAIAQTIQTHKHCSCIVTPDIQTAQQMKDELSFFLPKTYSIEIFPDWETLPYDSFSPHRDIVSQRLRILNQTLQNSLNVLIVPNNTLLYRLPPREYVIQNSLLFQTKQILEINPFRRALEQSGYRAVSQVFEHGEFAVRGSIIDLFPMGAKKPFRIDLFDNEIDTIRTFDIETQRSLQKIDSINLLPAHEFPLNETGIERFHENWVEQFDRPPYDCPLYESIMEGHYAAGTEYYLPLFFEKTESLFDYLSENTLVFYAQNASGTVSEFWKEIDSRHEQLRHDITHPTLAPQQLFLSSEDFFKQLKNFSRIKIKRDLSNNLPDLLIHHQLKQPLTSLIDFIKNYSGRILFVTETTGRREVLLNLLHGAQITPVVIKNWEEFFNIDSAINIAITPIQQGAIFKDENFVIITENELFGERVVQRRQRKTTSQEANHLVRNLAELQVDDPIVHLDHGVGRFRGLKIMTIDNHSDDYLVVEYAEKNKLYVPISSLHLISRYSSGNVDHAPLHSLGTPQWEKIKEKANKRIQDVAAELLEIYAKRKTKTGFQFKAKEYEYLNFSQAFPFEETPDQQKAIELTLIDMQSKKTMDRLVCGDVGFGKTEVAMRATFLAIQNNKQVVVLVPTTLLAQQHYQNFCDRFADWPVNIEMLSRFRTKKEQASIVEKLKNGKIDIIIGTHRLIQKDIAFRDLGLLILDEEHRFGVQHKEKIKAFRAEVDILALTATPIPRTLNMAFSNIRDLSIISTPPKKRLSIKTFLIERKDQQVREAILRELMRGGQIYFLHNSVATIQQTADRLKDLVPEAKIDIAHGQMRERQLEHVMSNFYHRRFNVLICTTIIESGIDVPTANTIIIERADKFGLAQLHQLRGRVGRSHHQAYAYLIIPHRKSITSDAKKRLDAITSFEDLGAGFTLATHDLEIRGAGELLGKEQSGHMQEMGFTLYMEMLEHTVKLLKSGKQPTLNMPNEDHIEIDLKISAIIPEDYLPDTRVRLILYKRIAHAKTAEELSELQSEMIDRFGLLPAVTKKLFEITSLKLNAKQLGIKKMIYQKPYINIEFAHADAVDAEQLITLAQKEPDQYKLAGHNRLKIKIKDNQNIQHLENCLHQIKKR